MSPRTKTRLTRQSSHLANPNRHEENARRVRQGKVGEGRALQARCQQRYAAKMRP